MNTNIIKSLFMLSSKFKFERGQLYQLIRAAESCYCLKDAEGQQKLGSVLKEFPNPFGAIGAYYEAFYLTRTGQYEKSQKNLEQTLIYAPEDYKAKSLIALGGLEERRQNFQEAMRFRTEVSKFNNISFNLEAGFGIAALLGTEGNHKHAIKILESFLPALRLLKGTPLYFDYLNSYAVELTEVGRIYEASNVIKIVVNSPYISHFQNWLETSDEIEQKGYRLRSAVSVRLEPEPKPDNVLHLPEPKPSATPLSGPAPVLSYMEWKKKMVKEQNDEPDENVDAMDRKDLLVKLLELTAQEDTDEEELRKIVKYAIKNTTSTPSA